MITHAQYLTQFQETLVKVISAYKLKKDWYEVGKGGGEQDGKGREE